MSTGWPSILAPEVQQMLVRLQQALLADGYRYVAGDPESWPLSEVVMGKDEDTLLIGVWGKIPPHVLREKWRSFFEQSHNAGLVLVGAESVDALMVRDFFATVPGTVAYIDALSLRSRCQSASDWASMLPSPLPPARLEHLLEPDTAARATGIDCRTTLTAHLQAAREAPVTLDPAQRDSKPWLTYLFIAACTLIFLAGITSALDGAASAPSRTQLLRWGALYGPLVRDGEWWRLLTSAFLHGGIIHLMFNMLAMFYFGGLIEGLQGRRRLAALFGYSIITGSLFSLWWYPDALAVGASGGLFGLVGAFAAMLIRYRRQLTRAYRRDMLSWLGSILAYNLVFSLLPGISLGAHLGGLVGGFLLGLIITRSPKGEDRLSAWSWPALVVLLAATVLLGVYVINRLPA